MNTISVKCYGVVTSIQSVEENAVGVGVDLRRLLFLCRHHVCRSMRKTRHAEEQWELMPTETDYDCWCWPGDLLLLGLLKANISERHVCSVCL